MTQYTPPAPTLVEVDPVASAALSALTALVATDVELASAVATMAAGVALKQDSATAATDAELASAIATVNAAMATDAELASAVAAWSVSLGLKQDALTAATDAELASAVQAINAVDVTQTAGIADLTARMQAVESTSLLLAANRALGRGSALIVCGPTLPATGPTPPQIAAGTEYVWNKTDGAGTLLDIVTGVAA